MANGKGTIVLAAGGTGGHLFPAEALAHELNARGWTIHLATDERARKYASSFPAAEMHVIESASPSGKNPIALLKAALALYRGTRASKKLLNTIKPKAVVGFGGYPTVPPLLAATTICPTMVHEQNAVAGRANKLLSRRVTVIAGGFLKAHGPHADRTVETGNPIRPSVHQAAKHDYEAPKPSGPIRLVVFGGSQGAQFFSQTMPEALALLPEDLRKRIEITQQARPEDGEAARSRYAEIGVKADVAAFFDDLPARLGKAHLVVARSGASTVSEIAAIGRPSILVPYPHALDHDQAANAAALEAKGGATVYRQSELSPEVVATMLQDLLGMPEDLVRMADAAKAAGKPDAATLLADLTEAIASGQTVAEFKAAQ